MNSVKKIALRIIGKNNDVNSVLRGRIKKTIKNIIAEKLFDLYEKNPVTCIISNIEYDYEPVDYQQEYGDHGRYMLTQDENLDVEGYDLEFDNRNYKIIITFQEICNELNCDYTQLSKSDKSKLIAFVFKNIRNLKKLFTNWIVLEDDKENVIADEVDGYVKLRIDRMTDKNIIVKITDADIDISDKIIETLIKQKYEDRD